MRPNELLRKFEKKFGQLLLFEKHLLEVRKLELFFQAAEETLEDRLLLLLQDVTIKGGFTTNWRRLEEAISLIAKQQHVKARGLGARMETTLVIVTITPVASQDTHKSANSSRSKTLDDRTLKELMKGIKKLKVEMSALKRETKPNST